MPTTNGGHGWAEHEAHANPIPQSQEQPFRASTQRHQAADYTGANLHEHDWRSDSPRASFDPTPLTIRIRSRGLMAKKQGLERCLQLEVMTGTLIRGTWKGKDFDTGQCTQS